MVAVKRHWQIFVFVLLGLALVCVFSIEPHRASLTEKAVELENGQFLCGDGTVWEACSAEKNGGKTAVKFIREIKPESIGEPVITRSEEMSATEYAQAVSEYGSVYADRSGGVWKTSGKYRHPDSRGDMYLQPYYSLSVPEVDFEAKSDFEMLEDSLYFSVGVFRSEDYHSLFFTMEVLLNDGWYILSEREFGLPNVEYTGEGEPYYFLEGEPDVPKGDIFGLPKIPRTDDVVRYGCELSGKGITTVPGSYRLKVYARKNGRTALVAEHEMTTEIKGSTLYINQKSE